MIFAKVENDNTVSNVLVVNKGSEKKSLDWLKKFLGGNWVRTYSVIDVEKGNDQSRRGLAASIQMVYDAEKDIFYHPQPYPSWTLNAQTFEWEPPVALEIPENKNRTNYQWDEESFSWVEVSTEND